MARQLVVWCLLLLVVAAAFASWQYRSLLNTLETESQVLLRLASQRADQHDAHLTALSVVANATDTASPPLFMDVAETITTFYPRIDNLQRVALDPSQATVGTAPLSSALAQQVREAALQSDGQLMLLADPEQAAHYLLVKRSPNTAQARYGLLLSINAAQLLDQASPFWSKPGALLRLSLPNGQVLLNQQPNAPATVQRSQVLASASQPLLLLTGLTITAQDLFPPLATTLILLLTSAAYLVALLLWRQRKHTRAAVEQARLSALESRLAHASRVNALGEMASGLTHELTQPLTAILAQTQACRRLYQQGNNAALPSILENTIAQAKRASSILERFRHWSLPQPTLIATSDMRHALNNVQALLAAQAASLDVKLTVEQPDTAVLVKADPVELEQVIFNLIRNALDAVAGQEEGRVSVTLKQTPTDAILDVSDNGPGIAPELRDRLFTPFTTTRPHGTGLGLALSQRLIERAQGDIFLTEEGPGATFRIILKTQPPLTESCS